MARTRQAPIRLSEIGIGVPLDPNVAWRQPPPRKRRMTSAYHQAAKECIDNPGEWRILAISDKKNVASHLASTARNHRHWWGDDANENNRWWEATWSSPDEDGLCATYIRFMTDEVETDE